MKSTIILNILIVLTINLNYINCFTISKDIKNSLPEFILITEVESDKPDDYRLFTSTNSLELVIGDPTKEFELILEKTKEANQTSNSTEKLHTRFFCEDGEDNTFEWSFPKDNTNCKVLTLPNGFENDFIIKNDNNNNNDNTHDIRTISIKPILPGKQQLIAHAKWIDNDDDDNNDVNDDSKKPLVNTLKAYITVNVGRSNTILLISSIIGWIYFAAWSVSFYPQLWDNFKRKSVIGLNFDFIALNITGFLSYSMFNISLYSIDTVRKEYEIDHPRSQIPVQVNDVVFAVHAVFATVCCIIQCFIYERGTQTVSLFSKIFLSIVWIGYVILAILVATTNLLNMLTYLYILSYVKLFITIIKYIPQAYFNYQRKSTVGWSIGNIFLDFTGGFLSMCQMFLLAHNYNDWITIFNNFTKFGLGFISILFDVLFILQHYVFYRHADGLHDSIRSLVHRKESSTTSSSDYENSLSKKPSTIKV